MAKSTPGQAVGGGGAGAGGNGAGGTGPPQQPPADAIVLAQQQLQQANQQMMAAQQRAAQEQEARQNLQAAQQAQLLAHQAEVAQVKADLAAAQLQMAQAAAGGAGGGGQGQQNPYHGNSPWDPSKHVAPTALYGPNPESATATSVADAAMALNTAVNEQPQTIPPEVERASIRLPLPEAKGRLAPYIRAAVVAASAPNFCKGTVVVEIERFKQPTADVFQAHPISKGISIVSFVPGARILASLEAHGILSDLLALLRLLLGDFNQSVTTPDIMKWYRGWTEHFILEWRKMAQLVNIIASFKEMPVGAPAATAQALKAAIRHSMTDAVGFATGQLVRATAFSMSNSLKPKFSSWLTALSAYGATWAVDPILFGSFGYDGAAERWTHHLLSGLSRKITYQTLIEFLPAVTGEAQAPTGTIEPVTPIEVPASSFWPSAQERRKVSPVIVYHMHGIGGGGSGGDGSGGGAPSPSGSTCAPTFSKTVFIQMLAELQRDRTEFKPSPFTNADVATLRKLGDEEAMFRGTCTTCHLSLGTSKGNLSGGSHTHTDCIKSLRVQKLVLNELAGSSQLSAGAILEREKVAVSRARNLWERNASFVEDRHSNRDRRDGDQRSPPRRFGNFSPPRYHGGGGRGRGRGY